LADGTLDSQVGARICNGLGIMRACLETQKLEQLEARMDQIAGDIGRQRLFRPLANPGEVEASCVFRALMRYEVKQHDFKMFEGDS
jgi:hypothetical protein